MSALLGTATGVVNLNIDGFMTGISSVHKGLASVASGGDPFQSIDAAADRLGDTLEGTATQASGALAKIDSASDGAAAALNQVTSSASSAGQGMESVDAAADQTAEAMRAVDASSDQVNQALNSINTSSGAAAGSMDAAGAAATRASQSIVQVDNASDRASRGLNKGSTDAEKFGAAVIRLESDITRAGGALAAFGGGITVALALAVSEFVSFEAAMRNVNSIAGLTEGELSKLGDSILGLSDKVGKGPTELAEGLYEIQSSGFEAAEGLEILEKASIAATAGITSTATASKAITAVLNAYGKSADEAGDVSDLLFSIVDKGVISFEGLAANLGAVIPVASALKVPFEQVAAAYAQLTLNGISAAQAETALAAVMRSAINPTEQLASAVEQYGYASAEAMIQAEGLAGYLDLLMTASGGSSEALSELLGTAEATTAVLALMNDGGAGLTAMMGEMSASMQDGAYTQGVFNEQAKSTQFTLQQLGAAFDRAKIAAGEAVAPFVRLGAEGLTAVLNGFTSLPDPVQSAATVLTGVVGVTAAVGGGFLLMLPRIVETVAAFKQIGGAAGVAQKAMRALSFVASPLGLALAAVGVAVGVGIALWNRHTDAIRKEKEAQEALAGAIRVTNDLIKEANLAGEFDLADQLEEMITSAREKIESFNDIIGDYDWFGNLFPEEAADPSYMTDFLDKSLTEPFLDWAYEQGRLEPEMIQQIQDGNLQALQQYAPLIQAAARDFYEAFKLTDSQLAEVESAMTPLWDLFGNPEIDDAALQAAMNGIMEDFLAGEIAAEDLDDAFKALFDDITVGADKFNILNDDLGNTVIEMKDMSDALKDVSALIHDLELKGMTDAARDIDLVNRYMEGFATSVTTTSTVLDEASGNFVEVTSTVGLTAEQIQNLTSDVDRLNQMLASGDYNNAFLMEEFTRIMNDPSLDPAGKAADLTELLRVVDSVGFGFGEAAIGVVALGDALTDTADRAQFTAEELDRVAQSAEDTAARMEQLALSQAAVSESAERMAAYEAAVQDVNDATVEWLGNGDNILQFLVTYRKNTSEAVTETEDMTASLGGLAGGISALASGGGLSGIDFELSTALGINEAAAGLDSVLNTFKEIDALAQRSASSESIASTLIGEPGELGTLQDLWDRITAGTSSATLSAGEYNAAISAGVEIQESNARVQDYIVSIQAKQLPLLAEQQAAYEEQLRILEGMSAEEQQRTIYMQSSNGQAQIANAYALAYSASIGEIPKEVVTELIANAVKADPVLASVLEELEFISYGAEGEVIVSFPDGPTVQDTIIELTRSIDALIEVMDGVPPLHASVEGEENVRKYIDDLTAFLEDDHDITITADTDQPTSAVDRLRNALDNLTGGGSGDDPVTRLGNALKNLKVPDLDLDVKWGDPPLASDFNAPELAPIVQKVVLEYGYTQGAAAEMPDATKAPTVPTKYPNMMDIQNQGIGNAITIPPIDMSALDQSLTEINAKINQAFGTDVPTAVTTGMGTTSTNVGTGAAGWGTALVAPLQGILTAVNATFVTAVPLNVLTGLQVGSTNISAEAGLWPGLIDAVAPAMGASGLNAGSVAGFGVANGMASAEGAINIEASGWPGIVNGVAGAMGNAGYNAGAAAGYGVANGMASALGSIQSTAAQIAAVVTSTLALQLLISSPSKVTTRLGEFVGEGFALGIASRKSDVERASESLTAAAERGMGKGEALKDIAWDLKMFQGDNTPKEIVDVALALDRMAESGNYTAEQIKDLAWELKMFNGDDTPRAIVDAALALDKIAGGAWNIEKGVEQHASGHGSRVQVPGGVSVEPGTSTGGGGGTGGGKTPEEIEWSDEVVDGLVANITDSIKNAGLEFDKTVGSIFSEDEWKSGMRLKDLFAGRTRVNDTGFLLGGGKYLEEYLGGLFPDETVAPYPPGTKVPDPTKPPGGGVSVEVGKGFVRPKGEFPNRPNIGSRTGGTTIIHNDYSTHDARTQYTPEPERFGHFLSEAKKGGTAHRAMNNVRTNRTLAHGVRSTPGRY